MDKRQGVKNESKTEMVSRKGAKRKTKSKEKQGKRKRSTKEQEQQKRTYV